MSFRNKTWQDIAALDEHLTVFLTLDEALERFLGDFGFSSHEVYKIGTDSGSVDRSSRAQISAAVDSLGGSLSSLEGRYTDPDGSGSVGITTQPFPAFPLYRIACALNVHGDDETETNGRFDTLRNRMDAEIRRQWPKSRSRSKRRCRQPFPRQQQPRQALAVSNNGWMGSCGTRSSSDLCFSACPH